VLLQGVRRLNAFLAALSQAVDLAHDVALEVHSDEVFAVLLTPPPTGAPLSQFYDAIQSALAAARLSTTRAQLFVGAGLFVPYADPAAPDGYDAIGAAPPGVRLALRPDAQPIALETQPDALRDALLAVPLLPAPEPQAILLSLITDRRMAALIAGYVQRHGLAYAVRFLRWQRGATTVEAALFDIVTADTVRPVPGFVIDFLRRLPATTLLSDALEPADLESEPPRRVLLAWGRRTALHLPHIQELLPANCLLISAGPPWGAALIAAPPARTTMQRLTRAAVSAPATIEVSGKPPEQLQLRLELRRNGVARGPIHALLLDAAGIARLQRIVQRLPMALFAQARVALGDGVALVLAAPDGELIGLPLGMPLARAEPPTLLLPRGMRLLPALPQDLLVPALGLQPDRITVLTGTSRYDIAPDALQPLGTLLSLDSPAQTGMITLRPSTLPPLDLSDLEELPTPPPPRVQAETAPPAPLPEKAKRTLLERLLGSQPGETPASGDFQTELRKRATELEQRGELELAAAFYTYLRDAQRAAACYQRLAGDSR
jgi:hypothetical protein